MEKKTDTICVNELLQMPLEIPKYQRPYKWTTRNIEELLSDISNASSDYRRYGYGYIYRLGTIIVHENEGSFEIVDGQQRIISLALLMQCLNPGLSCSIIKAKYTNKITKTNIYENYRFIKEWFFLKGLEEEQKFREAIETFLQVVIIYVDSEPEAFQLFDSQNTRGKPLDPHDLLKAYHLREMNDYPHEMMHAVTKWESKKTKDIRDLFDQYLYRILNWSRRTKCGSFTVKDIDIYKGIEETSSYSYAKRASRAMPYFQITEPFIAGNEFFEMVDHYINLLEDMKKEIKENERFRNICEMLDDEKNKTVGFKHAENLFYCALLYYYDRFHLFDEVAVKKLFAWAFMIRVDMKVLGFASINKYAIGETDKSRYTNSISMFEMIGSARLHNEISRLQIIVDCKDENQLKEGERKRVYDCLRELNVISGGIK